MLSFSKKRGIIRFFGFPRWKGSHCLKSENVCFLEGKRVGVSRATEGVVPKHSAPGLGPLGQTENWQPWEVRQWRALLWFVLI